MVIKASAGKRIDALIADLSSEQATIRDGAVARLRVLGARAARKVLAAAIDPSNAPASRAGAFRVLEAIADPRALEPALASADDPDLAVATAAIDAARVFLGGSKGVAALDRLTAVALDRTRPSEVRLAAVRALSDLDPATIAPVLSALRKDPEASVAAAASPRPNVSQSSLQHLTEAANGRLPDRPEMLRRALVRSSRDVPVTTLHRIVEHVKLREGSDTPSRRMEWMAARATAHVALAQQGSRLALYDLRETFEFAKEPVAVEFVAAMRTIGDSSCLESIAAAYAQADLRASGREDWWRRSLAEAFRAIVRRELITGRHAVAKRIEKRWPGLFRSLIESRQSERRNAGKV